MYGFVVFLRGKFLQSFRIPARVPPFLVFLGPFKGQYLLLFGVYTLVCIKWGWGFVEVDESLPLSGEGTWTEAREGGACCQRVLRLLFACQQKMGEGT